MACPDLSGFTHVVHLAGVGSPDASFEQVLRGNVVATQNVLEAAKRSGTVKRVVLALDEPRADWHVYGQRRRASTIQTRTRATGGPPLNQMTISNPDSFYAASKVHVEMLGKLYGKTWRCFDVVALRIGWCLYDDPTELAGTQYEAYLRAMWLSRRDWVGFATAALTAHLPRYSVFQQCTHIRYRRPDCLRRLEVSPTRRASSISPRRRRSTYWPTRRTRCDFDQTCAGTSTSA